MQSIQYPLPVGAGVTRIIEAGSGPAILFSHGLGARADRWRTTVERIADHGYRAIAWDLPGHGFASRDPDGPADVPGMAAYALSVLDMLGVTDCVGVGTSLGAHIVAYAACRAPDRFYGLGLVGALGIVPIAQEAAERISRNVQASSRDLFPGKLSFVLHDPALVTEALIEEEWRTNTAPGTIAGFARVGEYLTTRISNDYVASQLKELFPPDRLLLVWGKEDKAVSLSVAYACRDALGEPELAIVPAANHCPYLENPTAFDAALLPFLKHAFAGRG